MRMLIPEGSQTSTAAAPSPPRSEATAWIRWLQQEHARSRIFGGASLNAYLAMDFLRARCSPGRPPRPRLIQLEPVSRCNLSCVMCLRRQAARMDAEMPFALFRQIIERNFPYRHYLLLYGQGEPFLCRDLFRMIRYERDRRNSVIAVTNGTLLEPDRCRELAASDLNLLRISLDAATEHTFALVRPGASLRRILDGIDNLQRALSAKRARTELAVTSMVLRENYLEMPDLVRVVAASGIRVLELKDLPPYRDSLTEPLSVAMGSDPLLAREVAEAFALAQAEARRRGVRLITSRCGWKIVEPRCLNPWHKTFVSAEGFVAPCSKLIFEPPAVLGRLPQESFESIWWGSTYQRIRACISRAEAPFPGCERMVRP